MVDTNAMLNRMVDLAQHARLNGDARIPTERIRDARWILANVRGTARTARLVNLAREIMAVDHEAERDEKVRRGMVSPRNTREMVIFLKSPAGRAYAAKLVNQSKKRSDA